MGTLRKLRKRINPAAAASGDVTVPADRSWPVKSPKHTAGPSETLVVDKILGRPDFPAVAVGGDVTAPADRSWPVKSPKYATGPIIGLSLAAGVLACPDLSPATKLVLGLLRFRQGDRPLFQIRQRQIAAELGLSYYTVPGALRILKAAGLVRSWRPVEKNNCDGLFYSVT